MALISDEWKYRLLLVAGAIGVSAVFLGQDFQWLVQGIESPEWQFVARKVLRVLFNDLFMLMVVYSLFRTREALQLAFLVQLIDGLILLPLYLAAKLNLEGTSEISSPLLSQIHRLVVNPTLMILLIAALFFQKVKKK